MRLIKTACAAVLSAGLGLAAPAHAQEFVRIGTAGSGGNYYILGAGLSGILNNEIKTQASIQATGGTVENLDLLADREVELAYLSGGTGAQAYQNVGQFAERPEGRYKSLRAIATVYPNLEWFIAIDPSINSIRDLKGKRVAVGTQGSAGEAWWRQIMEHLGWTYNDIVPEYTTHQSTIDQIRNRQVDAVVWPDAPGSATIKEIVTTGLGVVKNVDDDIIKYMDEQGLDFPYTIPAEGVPGGDSAINTFASPITLATHEGVPEELIYQITKTMFEQKDALIKAHPLASYMNLEGALNGLPFPVHPGAKRYYDEQGMTVPAVE